MKNQTSITAILLAAGKGTRMKSLLPKVLHPVAGVPMIARVIAAAKGAGASDLRVVVGHGQDLVRQIVEPTGANCFVQQDQRGTADAVRSAKPSDIEGTVMILNGDHPLLQPSDLKLMLEEFNANKKAIVLGTCVLKKPGTYGRVVRSQGKVRAIVEAKDASADTLKISEINTGIYILSAESLNNFLPQIQANNAQNEFYLTDLIQIAIDNGVEVIGRKLAKHVSQGVNSQAELAAASKAVFKRKIETLMAEGVMVIDPKSTYVEDQVQIGSSTVLYPNVFLKGRTKIGQFCVVEPNCFLHDSSIGDSVQIRAGSYLEETVVHHKAIVGPYARLRPQTEIGSDARVGNFVEMKNVKFGAKAKANHLAYLGDAEIGEETNIGCGTITCNYAVDKKKYVTKIGKNVFIGSDSQFVAPVEIGDNAIIGSGSTITKNVPANALAVGRARQMTKENYNKK
jgi:bifunctional UDP-N-acetylglucosamine pyrophosphorylase/glucosamine-1-phosphate N-acetyltransferase